MSDFTICPTAFGRGEITVKRTHCAMHCNECRHQGRNWGKPSQNSFYMYCCGYKLNCINLFSHDFSPGWVWATRDCTDSDWTVKVKVRRGDCWSIEPNLNVTHDQIMISRLWPLGLKTFKISFFLFGLKIFCIWRTASQFLWYFHL